MILGDFRADGVYINHQEMKAIRIRSDKDFHWLIGDDVDTTANTSNEYTYDRHVHIHELHSYNSREDVVFFMWYIIHVTLLFLPWRNCTYCHDIWINGINLYNFLTGLLCTEKMCWQLLCQTQPSHSISRRSLLWLKKWWVVPHNQHVMHVYCMLSYSFFTAFSFCRPWEWATTTLLRLNCVTLLLSGWQTAIKDVTALTPPKHQSTELSQVKRKAIIYTLLPQTGDRQTDKSCPPCTQC